MRSISMLLCVVVFAQNSVAQSPVGSSAQQLAKVRTKHMLDVAKAYEGTRDDGKSKVKPIEKPLLSWSNQGQIDAGLLVGWEDENGVPVAIAQLWLTPSGPRERLSMELQSLSQEPFELTYKGASPWHPEEPGVEWADFPGKAVKPAGRKPLRLAQMRSLAKRFSGYNKKGPREIRLRLQTNPVLRYSHEESGLLDGAIFVSTFRGTDPELVIMIEARPGQGGYRYALARMTGYELHISFDNQKVWQKARHEPASPSRDVFVMRGGTPLLVPN